MILLPLKDASELYVVLDAMNVFASAHDDVGDRAGAEICDEIADRIRNLIDITTVDCRQWLRHSGVGHYKHRPQG